MKKVTVLFLLVTCLVLKGTTQELSYGPVVGVNSTWFSDDAKFTTVSAATYGPQVGFNVQAKFMDLVGAGFQVFYATHGGKDVDPEYLTFDNAYANSIDEQTITMHTIDLNLVANIYLFDGKGANGKYILGISNAYHIKAIAGNTSEIGLLDTDRNVKNDYTDRFEHFDFALVTGFGSEFTIFGKTFTAETRYRYGLTDINNVAMKKSFGSSGVQLLLGFNF